MNTAKDCIFCKIIAGTIKSELLYEDDSFVCIRDIHPKAKIHLLVLPKQHVVSLEAVYPDGGVAAQPELMGKLFEAVTKIARKHGLLPHGFRSIINTNHGGGQTVFHLHVHLLGGETLKE